jgi:hypothetical protein
MIESRSGKYAIVAALLILAVIFATSRPKKPRVVYPLAAVFAVAATLVAWRVTVAAPTPRSFPLGDPVAFIALVPAHVAKLAVWTHDQRVPPPPRGAAAMDEWMWDHREALGAGWQEVMHGLVAAYGEALRADTPALVWLVRHGEPSVGTPRALWPARRLFNEVHDAVFADM